MADFLDMKIDWKATVGPTVANCWLSNQKTTLADSGKICRPYTSGPPVECYLGHELKIFNLSGAHLWLNVFHIWQYPFSFIMSHSHYRQYVLRLKVFLGGGSISKDALYLLRFGAAFTLSVGKFTVIDIG